MPSRQIVGSDLAVDLRLKHDQSKVIGWASDELA